MDSFAALLVNEVRLRIALARRYWFESLFGLVLLALMLSGLLAAVTWGDSPSWFSGRADGLLIGFVVWIFATHAYAGASHDVADETRARTIEQLVLAPCGLDTLLALRTVLRIVTAAVGFVVLMKGLQWAIGDRLSMDVGRSALMIALAAPSLTGVGFAMAGLVLLVKRAESFQAVVYPALIALVALDAYPLNAAAILPYALGASAARAMAAGAEIDATVWAVVALNSTVWLALGVATFRGFLSAARAHGTIGHL